MLVRVAVQRLRQRYFEHVREEVVRTLINPAKLEDLLTALSPW